MLRYVEVDTDFFDRPVADEVKTIQRFPIVSVGRYHGNVVITFCVDDETREYHVIETGSVFYQGQSL